jgi:hypothetical protein
LSISILCRSSDVTAIIVADHIGLPDVSQPTDGPEFELFLKFPRQLHNVWSKVSSHRPAP